MSWHTGQEQVVDGPPAYEVPTWRQIQALEQIESQGPDGAPRSGAFGGRLNAGLLRRGLAELRDDRWYLTQLGLEALVIHRTGKRVWAPDLGRWIPVYGRRS